MGSDSKNPSSRYEAVVIGVSAGGLHALSIVIPSLPAGFPVPVAVVQHLHRDSDDYLPRSLDAKSRLAVRQAEEKETLRAGCVYLAPPNYHLLVEEDRTLSLSVDERVNFARPAIDLLFDSAADAFGPSLIGVILTGANSDGSRGLKRIAESGGYTIVQDPGEAEAAFMPRAALEAGPVDRVAPLKEIGGLLEELCSR